MEKEFKIKLILTLSDKNMNFDEILQNIYASIKQRDGVKEVFIEEDSKGRRKIKWW